MMVSKTQHEHKFRLLNESEPQSGERNMAIDEALLEATIRSGVGTFRIYRWSEPTVSLGYFQRKISDELPTLFRELPLVQRITGGGAILHHHEMTYSMTMRRDCPLLETPVSLYDLVHRWIIEAFAQQNIEVSSRGKSEKPAKEPFLCFLRSDPRDLLLDGKKIVGSAQRRRKGVILQHGSIILRASEWTSEIPGVEELSGDTLSEMIFCKDFAHFAGKSLHFVEQMSQCISSDELLRFLDSRIGATQGECPGIDGVV